MRKVNEPSTWRLVINNITKRFHKIFKIIFEKINPTKREFWDSHYISGDWDFLRNIDQLAPYSIIVGYFKHFKFGGSILDVGCGEGILYERLEPNSYFKYVGIDVSGDAISRISHKINDRTSFIRVDAKDYFTKEKFDVIIFNEFLYYIERNSVLDLIKKYDNFLKRDGIYIISIFKKDNYDYLWQKLESRYSPVDKTIITNKLGRSWVCKVFLHPDKKVNENNFYSEK